MFSSRNFYWVENVLMFSRDCQKNCIFPHYHWQCIMLHVQWKHCTNSNRFVWWVCTVWEQYAWIGMKVMREIPMFLHNIALYVHGGCVCIYDCVQPAGVYFITYIRPPTSPPPPPRGGHTLNGTRILNWRGGGKLRLRHLRKVSSLPALAPATESLV